MTEQAKSSNTEFEIPRGYLMKIKGGEDQDDTIQRYSMVRLREMDGEDEDIISDEDLSFTTRIMRVLGRTIVALGTDGGEWLTGDERPKDMVDGLAVSDILYLIVKLRQVTAGNVCFFRIRCPHPGCKTMQTKRYDLDKIELHPVKGDPNTPIREFTLRDGRVVTWEFCTGRAERLSEKQVDQKKKSKSAKVTIAMLKRVRTIDGEPADIKMMKKLPMVDRMNIRDEFDQEGGFDPTFETDCVGCGATFASDIPIGGASFFTPSEMPDD